METLFEVVKVKQVLNEVNHPYARFTIRSPEDAAAVATHEIGDEDREIFLVIVLNTKNQVIAIHRCHAGSNNASIVHPRDVFKTAILNNATSIVVSHQHPSGDPFPSSEDIDVTKRLRDAGTVLGIQVLDHVIVTHDKTKFHSLKEQGYL